MAKKNQEPPKPENHERWLLTYADLITLLMIFFVVMYTISNINAKKFAQLSASMSEALIGQNSGSFIGEAPGPLMIKEASSPGGQQELANLSAAKGELEKYIKKEGLQGKVEVSTEERGLVISLKEALLFNIGSASITPEARQIILKVGQILARLPNSIRIEGHTCNLPINTPQFPSNWELSTARATNVVRFLISQVGISPEKLSAAGYGEFRPLVPNTSEKNRAKNRRVDIVVLRSFFDIAEPGKAGQERVKELMEQSGVTKEDLTGQSGEKTIQQGGGQ